MHIFNTTIKTQQENVNLKQHNNALNVSRSNKHWKTKIADLRMVNANFFHNDSLFPKEYCQNYRRPIKL